MNLTACISYTANTAGQLARVLFSPKRMEEFIGQPVEPTPRDIEEIHRAYRDIVGRLNVYCLPAEDVVSRARGTGLFTKSQDYWRDVLTVAAQNGHYSLTKVSNVQYVFRN